MIEDHTDCKSRIGPRMHHKSHKRLLLAMAFGFWSFSGTTASLAHANASSASDAKQKAKELFERGNDYLNRKDYPRAAEEFEAAYKLLPDDTMLFNLAYVYQLKGDRKLAIDYYQRYLKAIPNGPVSQEAREYLQKLTEEQATEDRKRETSRSVIAPQPPSPSPPPPAVGDILKKIPPPRGGSKRKVWGPVGGGIGAAVAGGVIAGVLVGTAAPRADGTVHVP